MLKIEQILKQKLKFWLFSVRALARAETARGREVLLPAPRNCLRQLRQSPFSPLLFLFEYYIIKIWKKKI